jgi:hypothetical protein
MISKTIRNLLSSLSLSKIILVIVLSLVATFMARAWTGPSANPPSGGGANIVSQTVYKTWNTVISTTTNYTYVDVPDSDLSITAKRSGSIFKITVIAQGYKTFGDGVNIGIKYVGTDTLIAGGDGSSTGDAWMGAGNGVTTTSWNITRVQFHDPTVVAGNTYTYRAMLGQWSGATAYLNFSGYTDGYSIIMIEEIAQ